MSEPKKLQVYGKFGSGLKTVNGIGPDENGNVELPDGLTWTDLGEFDDVYTKMDEIVEDGLYRLSDGEFVFSLQVDRTSESYVGQTYWSEEEGRSLIYFRAGWYYDGELEWDDWHSHVNDASLSQYALKNHKHLQTLNTSGFETWINTFREGQHQVNIHSESKSYLVDQFVFNNKPTTTIHVCQRYYELTEPWKVYMRHGTTNGNYVLVDWDDWTVFDYSMPEHTWENLPDKPFGEETTTVGGDTLTWDGNTEGLVIFDFMGNKMYKVSDAVPTMDDLANGVSLKVVVNDTYYEPTTDDIHEPIPGWIMIADTAIAIISESLAGKEIDGIVFPKAGVYFFADDEGYTISLTIPGYTGFVTKQTVVKPLAEQYLPTLTSPSGKKFKLSVDDNGTITATEVT